MPVTCPTCQKQLANRRSLSTHKSRYHRNVERKSLSQIDNESQTDESESNKSYDTNTDEHAPPRSDYEIDESCLDDAIELAKRTETTCRQERTKQIKNANERTISIKNSMSHVKLIKLLCKGVLDGTIPLKHHHVVALKAIRGFVRKIAFAKIRNVKCYIEKEIGRDARCGDSNLKKLLRIVLPIIPSLFSE